MKKEIRISISEGKLKTTINFDENTDDEVKALVVDEACFQIYDLLSIPERSEWADVDSQVELPENLELWIPFRVANNLDETNIMQTQVYTGSAELDLQGAKIAVVALEKYIEELGIEVCDGYIIR